MKDHPVVFGVGAGVLGVVLWQHRGWLKTVFGKLTHPFHGAIGAGDLAFPAGSDAAIAFRQMRRYAFAAAQDKSPIVGLTHASYALVALEILEESVGRDGLDRIGCDSTKMRRGITMLQDMHAKRLESCDSYMSAALAMERGEDGGNAFAESSYSAPTGA